MESILTSLKKLIGIPEEITDFDADIIIFANSVFFILFQMGVGDKAFVLQNAEQKWSDFFGGNKENEAVKAYVYLKVKAQFDPPTQSFVLESLNKNIAEYEWRINVDYDDRAPENQNKIGEDNG